MRLLCTKIGLLSCDYVNPELIERHGTLHSMFSRFFGPNVQVDYFDVLGGELPDALYRCDAYVIPGSRLSVNDSIPALGDLEKFVVGSNNRGCAFVGICFGHQFLARCFGGKVSSAVTGWNVGIQNLRLDCTPFYSGSRSRKTWALFNHREQVIDLPTGFTKIGESAHCSNAVIYSERGLLGLQCHPEYTVSYQEELMRLSTSLAPELIADAYIRNAGRTLEPSRAGELIRRFINFHRQGND